MDSRKVILLVGALIVAAVAAFMARSLVFGVGAPAATAQPMSLLPPPAPVGPEVLVATKPLPVGTILDATMLRYQAWPKDLVQENLYFIKKPPFDAKSLQGTVVRNAITAGQPVTQGALVKPGDRGFLAAALGAGMRAVTVPVQELTSAGGLVFPGDRVDLILTQNVPGGGDGPPLKAAETIVRNLRVLATGQRTDNVVGEDGKTRLQGFNNVTVEATPRIAEQIAVAQMVGSLSLSLRSLADTSSELEQAIASGDISVPSDPKAENAMLARVASVPQGGRSTLAIGADVSRFQRSSVPGKTQDAPPKPKGPIVHVARGDSVTEVELGGKK